MNNDITTEQFSSFEYDAGMNSFYPKKDKRGAKLLKLVFIIIGVLFVIGVAIYAIWKLSVRRENTMALQLYSELQEGVSMGRLEEKIMGIDKDAEFEVDSYGDGFAKIGQDEYILFTCDLGIGEEENSEDAVEEDSVFENETAEETSGEDMEDEEELDDLELEAQGTYLPFNAAYDFMYMREIGDCQYYITGLEDGQFLMSNCDEMKEFATKEEAIRAYLSGQ